MPVSVTPTWNGNEIFGLATVVIPVSEPPRVQKTTYPGVKGTQIITLGSVGFRLQVSGLLADASVGDLAADELVLFLIEQQQQVGEFVDTQGNTYEDCLLENFRPTGPMQPYTDENLIGGVCRDFACEIFCPHGL